MGEVEKAVDVGSWVTMEWGSRGLAGVDDV